MTKRALSLLLTLVMVLSLCVPALAAEDFEAEAPAEVVEEAPEAPEAPVAPEAEEPADEPVVDEPAAEEPVEAAEDAPEMASVMPDDMADEPLLVALGVIDKLNHWKLEKAIKAAEPYKTRVDAGELYVYGHVYTATNTDFAKEFKDAYDKAVMFDDAIHGRKEATMDVTDAQVTSATSTLKNMFPADGSDEWTTAANATTSAKLYLTDTVAATGPAGSSMNLGTLGAIYPATQMSDSTVKNTYRDNSAYTGAYTGFTDNKLIKTLPTWTDTFKASDFDKSPWIHMYQADYLTAMKAAATAAEAYNKKYTAGTAKYSEYTNVISLIKAAEALEPAAALPSIADAQKIADLLKQYKDVAKNQKQDDYVSYRSMTGLDATGTGSISSLLKDTTGLNGFKETVRYYDYCRMLAALNKALTLKEGTAKILELKVDSMSTVNAKIGIPYVGNDNDGYLYGIAYTVNGLYSKVNNGAFTSTATDTLENSANTGTATGKNIVVPTETSNGATKFSGVDTDYVGYVLYDDATPIAIRQNIGDKNGESTTKSTFDANDVIVVELYQQVLTKDGTTVTSTTWRKVDSKEIKMPSDGYVGPVISTKDGAITVDYDPITTNKAAFPYKTGDLFKSVAVGTTLGGYKAGSPIQVKVKTDKDFSAADQKMVLIDANDDVIASATVTANAGKTTPIVINTQSQGEYLVTAAATKLQLQLISNSVAHSTEYVTFDSITTWAGMTNVKKLIADAQKIDWNDFSDKVTKTSAHPTVINLATARETITNDITNLQAFVNGGTYANTSVNRARIIDIAKGLKEVYDCLIKKTATAAELQDMVLAAQKVNKADYTYDSYGKMDDAVQDASKALALGLQSEIDKAYAALSAAMNGLVKEGEVDKSALKTAIDNAKALKEADYTAESWAANKAAIDAAVEAAQAVVDNAQATEAMVNTALNNLNTAVGKLIKVSGGEDEPPVEEGPKAPANGTGWNYYNGEWYFFKNSKLVANYWVGKIDGASQWDSTWYYVGADGKMLTGMQYIDDLHGGYGWYFLQPTDTKGEIGKMLTGYQWVGGQYGECYFSTKSGSSGKCTWSELLGNWNGTTWVK